MRLCRYWYNLKGVGGTVKIYSSCTDFLYYRNKICDELHNDFYLHYDEWTSFQHSVHKNIIGPVGSLNKLSCLYKPTMAIMKMSFSCLMHSPKRWSIFFATLKSVTWQNFALGCRIICQRKHTKYQWSIWCKNNVTILGNHHFFPDIYQ